MQLYYRCPLDAEEFRKLGWRNSLESRVYVMVVKQSDWYPFGNNSAVFSSACFLCFGVLGTWISTQQHKNDPINKCIAVYANSQWPIEWTNERREIGIATKLSSLLLLTLCDCIGPILVSMSPVRHRAVKERNFENWANLTAEVFTRFDGDLTREGEVLGVAIFSQSKFDTSKGTSYRG